MSVGCQIDKFNRLFLFLSVTFFNGQKRWNQNVPPCNASPLPGHAVPHCTLPLEPWEWAYSAAANRHARATGHCTSHFSPFCLTAAVKKKAASPWIHDGFETLLWSLKLTTTCAYWPFVKVLGTLCINLWTAILTCARVTRSSWGMLLLAKPICVLCCCCCRRRPDGSCITVPASCQWFPRHGEAVKHPPICSH